jgi:hypothetical protein
MSHNNENCRSSLVKSVSGGIRHHIVYWVRLFKMCFYYIFVDGWIERKVGKAIKRYTRHGDVFIDVGCGNVFKVAKYLPSDVDYHGFDIKSYSINTPFVKPHYHIYRASGTHLPIGSNNVNVLACIEVLYEVRDWKDMLNEFYRVCKNGSVVILTISNMKSYKYQRKGLHEKAVNSWAYEEFVTIMRNFGFELVEGCMLGWWVPIMVLGKISLMIPLESSNEDMNCNFIYVFRVKK